MGISIDGVEVDEITIDGEEVQEITVDGEIVYKAFEYVPGPSNLVAGTMESGYFGEVSANDLITGEDLCTEIGLSEGTLQHSDENWLKFANQGKILFIHKKTIRHSVSWDAIYDAGAVYGDGLLAGETGAEHHNPHNGAVRQDTTVTIDGSTYKVRLMKGAGSDPTDSYADDDRGSLDRDENGNIIDPDWFEGMRNEWNALMLPIHANADGNNWAYPDYVPANVPDWEIGFTDEDLFTHNDYGDGSFSLCQETRDTHTSRRLHWGYYGASYVAAFSSGTSTSYGFRPVLELL